MLKCRLFSCSFQLAQPCILRGKHLLKNGVHGLASLRKQALLLRIFSATPVAERNMARNAPRSCGSASNMSGSRAWPQAVPQLKSNRGKATTATLGDRAAKDGSLSGQTRCGLPWQRSMHTSSTERAWAWSDITSSLSERPPMTVSFTMKPATSRVVGLFCQGPHPCGGPPGRVLRRSLGSSPVPGHLCATRVTRKFRLWTQRGVEVLAVQLSSALSDGEGWEAAFATASSARRSSQALESALGSCCSESSDRL